MNYTEKYHLPQWVKEDRIMMDDFNRMCADMEAGLCKNASDTAEVSAKAEAGAAAAQAAADQAAASAAAAQAAANAAYSPSYQPYVVGSYTGTTAEIKVTVGFRPKFVIIGREDSCNAYEYMLAAGNGVDSVRLVFSSTGFTVKRNYVDPSSSTQQIPYTNEPGVKYIYIAFR